MRRKPGKGSRVAGDGSTAPSSLAQNDILSSLPQHELDMLLQNLSEISLTQRQELFEPGDALEQVYFPLNAMISLMNELDDGTAVEVIAIGHEGFVGFTLLNDVKTARYKGICQIAGNCVSGATKNFLGIIDKLPELRRSLHRYSQFATEVTAQSVACNSVHDVEQRLARWLLITCDAVGSGSFDITQEFLSQMLAVRRPGVTVAMAALERRGLIEHRYGKVTLIDVEGLKKRSCECYRRIREKASELLSD